MELTRAGIDFLRFPLPWFGQRCISPGLYRECVSDINGRFFSRLHQAGVYTVLHTCGGYGDRLDLLLQEPASASDPEILFRDI